MQRQYAFARTLAAGLAPLVMVVAASVAQAQAYPDKPIRLIVPFAPGGGADYFARPLGQKLTESLGQAIVIDNRPGANGAIGAERVMGAAPDGYTLLFGSAGVITIGPAVNPKLRYNPDRDFLPVALIVNSPFSLIVHPSVGAKTLKELIAIARAQPEKLRYGSSGVGGAPHLAGELFDHVAKARSLHVAYKGVGAMVTDLLAGRIEMTFIGLNIVQQHVAAGKLQVLAVADSKRSPIAPEIPTMAEAGLPGLEAGTWYGVLAPAKTPRAVITKLNTEINRALDSADMRGLLAKTGGVPPEMSPEQFASFMRTERAKWAELVRSAKIVIE